MDSALAYTAVDGVAGIEACFWYGRWRYNGGSLQQPWKKASYAPQAERKPLPANIKL